MTYNYTIIFFSPLFPSTVYYLHLRRMLPRFPSHCAIENVHATTLNHFSLLILMDSFCHAQKVHNEVLKRAKGTGKRRIYRSDNDSIVFIDFNGHAQYAFERKCMSRAYCSLYFVCIPLRLT